MVPPQGMCGADTGYVRCLHRVCVVPPQGMCGASTGYVWCLHRVCVVPPQGMRGAESAPLSTRSEPPPGPSYKIFICNK